MKARIKLLLPIAVVLAGVAAAAFIVKARPEVERQEAAVPPPLVRVVEVRIQDLHLDVAGQGTVAPRTEATLVAQVAGRIDRVAPAFAEGGFFRRGAPLLWIEDTDYRLALSQAEAAVAQASVRLERERAEAELARREWEQLGEGEASALTRREPQLTEARASLAAAQASLEQARLNLSRTRVAAPYDGRVRSRLADVGQFVAPGTPLAAVYATAVAEIRVPVPKDDLAFLDLDLGRGDLGDEGPQVVLSAELGGARRSWRGRVARADSGFDPRTRMLGLYVEVRDPFNRSGAETRATLPMGLFVEAAIAGRVAEDVAVLPRAALRDGDRVLVVDDRGALRYRDVVILRKQADEVIVSRGLTAGELVCVSPLDTVVDGMTVRTVTEETPLATDRQREELL